MSSPLTTNKKNLRPEGPSFQVAELKVKSYRYWFFFSSHCYRLIIKQECSIGIAVSSGTNKNFLERNGTRKCYSEASWCFLSCVESPFSFFKQFKKSFLWLKLIPGDIKSIINTIVLTIRCKKLAHFRQQKNRDL